MTSSYVKSRTNPVTGKTEYRSIGSSIKANDGNKVSGYLVRFTDADDPDLHGEYFTKSTNFWLGEHGLLGKPVMIDHAFDDKFKSVPVGIIDFIKQDAIGIWIEAKLKERAEYEDMLRGWKDRKYITLDDGMISQAANGIENAVKTFFNTGKVQWSSGALPQSVEVADDGHIESWAFIEGTGVMTPAEPDGTEIQIKSAFSLLDDILNSVSTATATKGASKESKESDADNAKPNDDNTTSQEGDAKMTREEFMAILKQLEDMIASFSTESGVPEEDAMAMVGEVEDELKALEDEEIEKMEDPEEVAEKAFGLFKAKIEKYEDNARKVKSAFAKKADAWKASQPIDDNAYLPSANLGSKGNGRVSVGDNLKFAHLSATDMAMAWKIATSADKKPRGLDGRNATEFVSEEFYRNAMHKMSALAGSTKFSRPEDAIFVKSTMPFKADELNASDITGQGLEWLGNTYDTTVWEEARNNQIYQLMLSRGMQEKAVPQGSKTTTVAIEGDDPAVYGGIEGNSVDSSGRPETVYKITPQVTSTIDVTPGTFRTATAYTFELGEDSFIDMASEANRKVRLSLEEHIEKAMINNDTETAASTNINDIAGTPTAAGLTRDYFLEFNGLRKSPLVTSTAFSRNGGTLAIDDYRRTWSLLGSKQAPRKDNIFFLIDFNTFNASLDLLPTLTKDVAGERASLFTGEFDRLWGIPVYMSGFLALSNSAGKIDLDTPGNNTQGQIMAVYAPYWAFSFKRNITIEMQRSPESESFEFYGSMRFALTRRSNSASAISYNLTV